MRQKEERRQPGPAAEAKDAGAEASVEASVDARYAALKRERGLLDFDDLVSETVALVEAERRGAAVAPRTAQSAA